MNNDEFLIAERAYAIWLEHGCPQGTAEQDWEEAKRQLAGLQSSRARTGSVSEQTSKVDAAIVATFPASDPPSSHGPDNPPSNAEAKWQAAGIRRRS
jgi:Protein of unknown function (DUF2934)